MAVATARREFHLTVSRLLLQEKKEEGCGLDDAIEVASAMLQKQRLQYHYYKIGERAAGSRRITPVLECFITQ
jgi:hypothetical protein